MISDQQNVTKTMTPRADHVPGLYSLQVAPPPLTSGSVSPDQSESVSHSEHRSVYCKKLIILSGNSLFVAQQFLNTFTPII